MAVSQDGVIIILYEWNNCHYLIMKQVSTLDAFLFKMLQWSKISTITKTSSTLTKWRHAENKKNEGNIFEHRILLPLLRLQSLHFLICHFTFRGGKFSKIYFFYQTNALQNTYTHLEMHKFLEDQDYMVNNG